MVLGQVPLLPPYFFPKPHYNLAASKRFEIPPHRFRILGRPNPPERNREWTRFSTGPDSPVDHIVCPLPSGIVLLHFHGTEPPPRPLRNSVATWRLGNQDSFVFPVTIHSPVLHPARTIHLTVPTDQPLFLALDTRSLEHQRVVLPCLFSPTVRAC